MTALLAVFATVDHARHVGQPRRTDRAFPSAGRLDRVVRHRVRRTISPRVSVLKRSRLLSATDVTDADFEQVVLGFDFAVAGLFDTQGRLLVIWPGAPI